MQLTHKRILAEYVGPILFKKNTIRLHSIFKSFQFCPSFSVVLAVSLGQLNWQILSRASVQHQSATIQHAVLISPVKHCSKLLKSNSNSSTHKKSQINQNCICLLINEVSTIRFYNHIDEEMEKQLYHDADSYCASETSTSYMDVQYNLTTSIVLLL